jgi:predicted phosphodiesterase
LRIAVISDIHGNLLALEAVESDLKQQAPDEVWCAGDLAWAGPWASECIERVRSAGWVTIKGNTDVWIGGDPQTIEDPDERESCQTIARAHGLPPDDIHWLLELPPGHSGPGSVLMVHGTPETAFDAPMPDAPAADFVPYEGQASLVIYGHVHRAFVRRLKDGTIVANPGSVGLPMDGLSASYLLVDLNPPEFTLRHRRVQFDREACIDRGRTLGGPVGELFVRNLGEG